MMFVLNIVALVFLIVMSIAHFIRGNFDTGFHSLIIAYLCITNLRLQQIYDKLEAQK